MKTLSGIVHSYTDTLVTRAAEMGAVIMPPMPAFYHQPQSIQDIVDQTVNRVLDQFDIQLEHDLFTRWHGTK